MDTLDPAQEFRQEADELLIRLEETLLRLEQSPDDEDLVDRAFGVLHSLKGAGMTFGWDALAAFVHQVETTLVQVRNGVLAVTPALIALALGVADHIRTFLEQPESVDPNQSAELLAAIADLLNAPASPVTPTKPSSSASPPPPAQTNSGESFTERLTLQVPLAQLNHLMEQVVELGLVQERLSELITQDTSHPTLQAIGGDLERLAQGLRNTTMTLRMWPIGTLFRRFHRVVHDLSHQLGKSVTLVLSGESITIDKVLIRELYTPLLHLIRNAIDHGIEPPLDRLAEGKPAVGRLHLGAQRLGDDIVITLEDDGRGLDGDALRVKAEACGLIPAGATISQEALFGFVFHAGLSTAQEVTTVSGRGFGMDVVRRTADNLHGTITLQSEAGQGVTVVLRLPLSLTVIDRLLLQTDQT